MKSRYGIGYFLVFIITGILFAGLFFGCSPSDKKVDEAGKYVLSALKAKYKKEFVIKDGHYITNTGGYEFTVYPKDDPEFTFNAWLNGMTESGESDIYLLMKQKDEATELLRPFISAISNDYYISTIDAGPIFDIKNRYKELGYISENQLTINQMIEKYPGKMSLSLVCHINYDITPKTEDSVLKKVYSLIEFLKEKKFGVIRISFSFYDLPNRSIRKLGKEDINFSSNYMRKGKYWLTITPENINSIHSYKDLKKLLRDVSKIKFLNSNGEYDS